MAKRAMLWGRGENADAALWDANGKQALGVNKNGALVWEPVGRCLVKSPSFNTLKANIGSPSRIRTYDQVINSHLLYR